MRQIIFLNFFTEKFCWFWSKIYRMYLIRIWVDSFRQTNIDRLPFYVSYFDYYLITDKLFLFILFEMASAQKNVFFLIFSAFRGWRCVLDEVTRGKSRWFPVQIRKWDSEFWNYPMTRSAAAEPLAFELKLLRQKTSLIILFRAMVT